MSERRSTSALGLLLILGDQSFTAHIGRLRTELTFTTATSAAAFVHYSSADNVVGWNVRFRYNPTEGTDLYLVWDETLDSDRFALSPAAPPSQARTLLVKYSRTFTLGLSGSPARGERRRQGIRGQVVPDERDRYDTHCIRDSERRRRDLAIDAVLPLQPGQQRHGEAARRVRDRRNGSAATGAARMKHFPISSRKASKTSSGGLPHGKR